MRARAWQEQSLLLIKATACEEHQAREEPATQVTPQRPAELAHTAKETATTEAEDTKATTHSRSITTLRKASPPFI